MPALDDLRPGARIDPLPVSASQTGDHSDPGDVTMYSTPRRAERLDDRLAAVRLVFHGANRSMMN